MRSIAIVYQVGIANVFDITDYTKPKRLLQHTFEACGWFARGMAAAGASVCTLHCNRAGDIALCPEEWKADLEDAPFREQFMIVETNY